jgi:hypothetical protein
MRALALLAFLLTACSSNTAAPDRAASAPPAEQKAAASTDQCLDNPELARSWGDCNVKSTVYGAEADLAKCRALAHHPKGEVNFQLKIKADGSVRSAKVLNGRHGKLTNCVAKVFKKLKFASPGKDVAVTVPFELE